MKSVSVRAVSRQVVCTKIVKKTDEIQFRRLLAGWASRMEYTRNSKGGLEDAAYLHEVCDEAQTVFGRQKHFMAPGHPDTPNWAPCEFLFLRMKSQLHGHRLQDMDKIRSDR